MEPRGDYWEVKYTPECYTSMCFQRVKVLEKNMI